MVSKYRYIDADLSSTKYCGFDDFLRALGFDPELYQEDDETIWKITSDKTTLQLRNEYCKGIKQKTQRYGPFCELANHIISQLPSQGRPIAFCRSDPHYVKGVFSDDRKPDVVVLSGEDPAVANEKWREHSLKGPQGTEWTWTDVLHIFEFKTGRNAIDYKDVNVLSQSDAVFGGKVDASPQVNNPPSSCLATVTSVVELTIPPRPRTDVERFEAAMIQPHSSSKRKYMRDEDDPDIENPNGGKKPRRRGPRRDLMEQAVRYAVDKLWFDINLRHTISGLIDDGDLRMCYHDRAGIVCSRGLRFVDDLYRFVLLIKALVELSPEDRGIMERMRRVISGDGTEETCSAGENVEPNTASSYLTSFPDERSVNLDLEAGVPEWRAEVGRHKVLVHDPLDIIYPYNLLGRAKILNEATCESLNPTNPHKVMMIKMSWPAARRVSEVFVLRRARDVLDELDMDTAFRMRHGIEPGRKLSDCLPRVLACDDLGNLGDRGFRNKLGVAFEDNRIFRTIVFELLFPVYGVADLSVFKQLFREVVQGHHFLFTSSSAIKHCDIGLLTVRYRVLPNGTLQGVLHDWDLAEVGDSNEKDAKRTLTESRPFMAIDLLEERPPEHIERFDWESIFYVLLWIGCHYIDGHRVKDVVLVNWLEHDMGKLKSIKVGELIISNFGKVLDHFKPLVNLWLNPLKHLFHDGHYARERCPDGEPFDDETLGGHVTYDKVWDVFQRD